MANCFNIGKGISTIITYAPADSEIVFNSGVTYTSNKCANWAVIYQNAFGGWDSFLIEGTVYKSGTFNQYTYAKAYDNATLDRENVNYANEITYSYTCTTGWLTDEESARLAKHLLPSPNIYLQDIAGGEIIPVTMVPSNYKFKTYQNEGKKMVNYTFTLKEANNKVRQY